MLSNAIQTGQVKGASLTPNGTIIHSLMYADDLMIVGQATPEEARSIFQIIQVFCNQSGQTLSWNKSSILFSSHTPINDTQDILSIFPVSLMNNTSKHLGHPLILNTKARNSAYNFIIEKFKTRLSIIKAKTLSHAGRLSLIKSVFASIPVYYMSTILHSKKLLNKLTDIIRKFWWTGNNDEDSKKRICWKSWFDICKPFDQGGLGIRDLLTVNKSLLIQCAWRILENPNNLVSKILKEKYFPHGSFWKASTKTPKSAFWSSILKIRHLLDNSIIWQLSQGDISIWNQPWCSVWKSLPNHITDSAMTLHLPTKVSHLWNDRKEWDISKVSRSLILKFQMKF